MKNSNVENEALAEAMFNLPTKEIVKTQQHSQRPVDSRTLNCIGWEVQILPAKGGVISMSTLYATKKDAVEAMGKMTPYEDATYRVYEALEIMEKK